MKQVTIVAITLALLAAPIAAQTSEVMTRDDITECIADSYNIERKYTELEQRLDELSRANREINDLDSRLEGLDWNWNVAQSNYNTCRVTGRSCQYEAQKLDRLTTQYNNGADLLRRTSRALQRESEKHNRQVESTKRLEARFHEKCTSKEFYVDDIKELCEGENTAFCTGNRY